MSKLVRLLKYGVRSWDSQPTPKSVDSNKYFIIQPAVNNLLTLWQIYVSLFCLIQVLLLIVKS